MNRARVVAVLSLAALVVALSGCGSDDDSSASSNGNDKPSTLKFKVDPAGAKAFTTSEVSAASGKVKVVFDNPGAEIHDLTIDDSEGKRVGQTYALSESTDSIFVKLKSGEYTFYCSFAGHREAGMEGTITVE